MTNLNDENDVCARIPELVIECELNNVLVPIHGDGNNMTDYLSQYSLAGSCSDECQLYYEQI